jgi:hypothetical protein
MDCPLLERPALIRQIHAISGQGRMIRIAISAEA